MLNHRLASCYRYLVALLLSLATFFPLTAEALYQYEYTGNTITGAIYSVRTDEWDPLIGNVTVSFTTANLLTGGEDFSDVTGFVMNFNGDNFNDDQQWPNEFWPWAYDGVFTVSSVDANGLPTDWNMSINFEANLPTGRYVQNFIGTSTDFDKATGAYETWYYYQAQSIIPNPGTWAVTSPVPEPETYAMMLAGLGMIGFVSRRKKQK